MGAHDGVGDCWGWGKGYCGRVLGGFWFWFWFILRRAHLRSIVLRCDDHTCIFTCDGCARDPYFYVPAETQYVQYVLLWERGSWVSVKGEGEEKAGVGCGGRECWIEGGGLLVCAWEGGGGGYTLIC